MSMPSTVERLRRPAGTTVRLRDGGVSTLRPLLHGETEPLLSVFGGLSEQSRALRYLSGVSRLPGPMLRALTAVDGVQHVAWLAAVDGEPTGIARCVRTAPGSAVAELAYEVVDRHHGRGIGTALVDAVTTVAAARGVATIQGTLAPANTTSRRLLVRLGATSRLVAGLVEAEGPLRLLDPPVVERAAVVRLAGEALATLSDGAETAISLDSA